jgi:S-adenosylmethionine:tRNA-ribosyltransferase-isomerase (queuine synthetase)
MYATAPGQTAADGDGTHSPFTESLLKNIKTPNIEIEQLTKKLDKM